MNPIQFVVVLLLLAAGFMAARWLAPHFIDGVSVDVAVALCALALLGAVIGLVRG